MSSDKLSKVCAIIVAAGNSRRMNGLDKVTATVAGKPVLTWSIEALQRSPRIDRIILVSSQTNLEPARCLVLEQKWSKVAEVCLGGKRRQDSVAAGLGLVNDCEWVVIHDGARPLLTEDLIERGLEAAARTGAAVAAVPVIDTIKLADEDLNVLETPPRDRLWAVQTPQIFRLEILQKAYLHLHGDVTDDASAVEQIGVQVKLFMGSYDNIKITTPRDLALAECLIKENGQ
jgi:2-C-methyl-D-erythritol 4-phosphate cytidylyltransferase